MLSLSSCTFSCAAQTNVVFEGIPTYPTPSRFWEIIDKYQVRDPEFVPFSRVFRRHENAQVQD